MGKVGTTNESVRVEWLKGVLDAIPDGARILDAGAGQQQFKKFCSRLDYVSQDFGKYDGSGNQTGLQKGEWNQVNLDIVCDISSIPEPDESFDAIMCIEVFEHLPDPILAIKEFSRLLRKDGYFILTAPFCSLTHFAPFHFSTGFNRYYYEKHLIDYGFRIEKMNANGNFFEYLAQEILRVDYVAKRYIGEKPEDHEKEAMEKILNMLERFSLKDNMSSEFLCHGYHILARKV